MVVDCGFGYIVVDRSDTMFIDWSGIERNSSRPWADHVFTKYQTSMIYEDYRIRCLLFQPLGKEQRIWWRENHGPNNCSECPYTNIYGGPIPERPKQVAVIN